MTGIGILCGLAAEATALGRWSEHPDVTVAVSGANPEVVEAKARVMAAEGARLLVSWGMASGLAPALQPGSILIGSEIIDDGGAHLPLTVPPGRWGRPLLGRQRPVSSAGEKARLHAETHADSSDLQSLAVARIAAEMGVTALAIRAVADPAGRDVPDFLTDAVTADGRTSAGKALAGLFLRPHRAADVWRYRGERRRALQALRAFADSDLGVVLGLSL